MTNGTQYSYRVCAYDAVNNISPGITTSCTPQAAVNQAPVLERTDGNWSSDGIDPEVGTGSTTFVYRVEYNDPDGDEPMSGYPKVHILKSSSEIIGSPFTMDSIDSDPPAAGRTYSFSKIGLADGSDYTYYFEAYDIHGAKATGEPATPRSGPVVQTGNLRAFYVPSGGIPNPYINQILIDHGFEIDQQSQVPNDMSNYQLLILSDYDASNQTAADYIKNFVQSGGGAIIMSGCPKLLAGNTDNLSYIKDWFGTGWYGNDCGYGTVVIPKPFGTDLLVNDKVDYSITNNCWAAAIYDLDSDATCISKWSSYGDTHSFIHTFGQGRVFYYAGNPGYCEDPDPKIKENSLVLFEAGLLWAANISAPSASGIFRNGYWFLDYSRSGQWDEGVDSKYKFGSSGDIPVTGKWW